MPFFSRRIGLDANGNPQTIDVGGKLTGQIGTQRRRRAVRAHRRGRGRRRSARTSPCCARKHRMLRQSYVGGLYTRPRRARGSTAPARCRRSAPTSCSRRRRSCGSREPERRRVLRRYDEPGGDRQEPRVRRARSTIRTIPGARASSTARFRRTTTRPSASRRERGFRRHQPGARLHARGRAAIAGSARIQYRRRRRLHTDTDDNGLLNRDVDVTLINVEHALAGHLRRARAADLRAAGARLHDQPRHHAAAGAATTASRAISFRRQTAQRRVAGGRPDGRDRRLLHGHARRTALDLNVRVRPGVIIYTSGEWNRVELPRAASTRASTASCPSCSSARGSRW